LPRHTIPLLRDPHDHVEIGAPLVKTDAGWLMIYSYIKNYRSSQKFFGVEAALLDLTDPQKVLGHSTHPILYPEFDYELTGLIPNIVFPSGALVYNNNLGVYYGAADMRVCLATCALDELLEELTATKR
jgi:beta-1,2-mannobiose phosphorylase / 1,2-beta-oligomannan phosphorylase